MLRTEALFEVPLRQFVEPPLEDYVRRVDGPKRRWRMALVGLSGLAGWGAWRWASGTLDVDSLLVLQSILIGLIAAMMLQLWNDGIAARRDHRKYDGDALRALDRIRADLAWAQGVGLLAALATSAALFLPQPDDIPSWLLGVIAGSSAYLLLLFSAVMVGMGRLYLQLR